jgi:hypothetical protein
LHANLILGVIVVVGGYYLYRWLVRTAPATVARYGKKTAIWAGIALLLFLVATGRLNWLVALVGTLLVAGQRLLPLLKFAPLAQQLHARYRGARAAQGPAPGQQSSVETAFLRMALDHDSGRMVGIVRRGRYRNQAVESLSLDELLNLLLECQNEDQQSVPILEAYLDRMHGDAWRERFEARGNGNSGSGPKDMSVREAYEVLGLAPGASPDEIRDAHRRLMQKMHPDRGGSSYLATKINQAKDLLLSGVGSQ